MGKHDFKNKKVFSILIIAAILITGIMIGFNILQHMALNENNGDAGENQQYDYHIAMIVRDSSDEFWQSVYKAARNAGMKNGIYIENFGEVLNEGYTPDELMEMAILARVDGIILEADSSDRMIELINEADNLTEPIPVITINSDANGSQRKSFVTAIDYALGEKYGSQVLEVLEVKGQEVVVLLPYDVNNSQPSLVYSGIGEALQNSTMKPDLSVEFLSANDEFGAEEQIRNLLLSTAERPDVVVCLSAVDTISTYQCIVDYNLVGEVQIIGTYTSSEILKGIQKGTIHSSIAVNAEEMGTKAADGMYEYLTNGYVSEHLPVLFERVSQENWESYIQEEQHEKK